MRLIVASFFIFKLNTNLNMDCFARWSIAFRQSVQRSWGGSSRRFSESIRKWLWKKFEFLPWFSKFSSCNTAYALHSTVHSAAYPSHRHSQSPISTFSAIVHLLKFINQSKWAPSNGLLCDKCGDTLRGLHCRKSETDCDASPIHRIRQVHTSDTHTSSVYIRRTHIKRCTSNGMSRLIVSTVILNERRKFAERNRSLASVKRALKLCSSTSFRIVARRPALPCLYPLDSIQL